MVPCRFSLDFATFWSSTHPRLEAMGPIYGSKPIGFLYLIGPWTLDSHLKWLIHIAFHMVFSASSLVPLRRKHKHNSSKGLPTSPLLKFHMPIMQNSHAPLSKSWKPLRHGKCRVHNIVPILLPIWKLRVAKIAPPTIMDSIWHIPFYKTATRTTTTKTTFSFTIYCSTFTILTLASSWWIFILFLNSNLGNKNKFSWNS